MKLILLFLSIFSIQQAKTIHYHYNLVSPQKQKQKHKRSRSQTVAVLLKPQFSIDDFRTMIENHKKEMRSCYLRNRRYYQSCHDKYDDRYMKAFYSKFGIQPVG